MKQNLNSIAIIILGLGFIIHCLSTNENKVDKLQTEVLQGHQKSIDLLLGVIHQKEQECLTRQIGNEKKFENNQRNWLLHLKNQHGLQ